MNIALIAQQRIFASIRNHVARMPIFRTTSKSAPCRAHPSIPTAPVFVAGCAVSTGSRAKNHLKTLPRALRVLRVVETGQSASSVGRMVISGRMADVCAELDRLAAQEAALT